ncbi:MAG: amidase [Gammaproteobacteria bacterium AqS3]|nr:amidase [Gammaproteobacteria bacterium AqS3]
MSGAAAGGFEDRLRRQWEVALPNRHNAWVHLADFDELLRGVRGSDERARQGRRRSPLDGHALAVKDNIDVAGMPTGAGLGGAPHRAESHADVIERAQRAGMLIAAKLNMDEAAIGATGNNPHWGRCLNPLAADRQLTPGGSSGGSAVWVASGCGEFALGTDTMGSVRIPAAYCGICGLKPSGGWLSLRGVVPVSAQLDSVGLMARRPVPLAGLLEALSGRAAPAAGSDMGDIRLGWVTGLSFAAGDVQKRMDGVREVIAGAGRFELSEVSLADLDLNACRRAGLVECLREMLRTHRDHLDGDSGALSSGLRKMLAWAAGQPPERFAAARQRLRDCREAVDRLFEAGSIHGLLLPTTPQGAFEFTCEAPDDQANFTAPFSISGHPAISIPLPAAVPDPLRPGLQIVGRRDRDFELLRLAERIDALLNPADQGEAA